jgi:hypothetical protein
MKPKGDNIHQILRRTILNVNLNSLTSPYWYDSFGNLVPWSDSQTLPPPDGEIIGREQQYLHYHMEIQVVI